MSRAILTTMPAFDTYPGLLLAVEIAWSADLTDLDGSSWTWSDITDDVILSSGDEEESGGTGISITLGRPDFSSETQSAELTCVLDNRDSAYSEGGLSLNWPNVRRGTPIRVRVSTNGGSSWSVRFQGAANGFTPQWDPETGRWATVVLSASGPLRKLNQGTGIYISAMREGTIADPSVLAYLPCEDRQHSTFMAPAVGTARGLFRVYDSAANTFIDGTPGECASYGDIPSSAPVLAIQEGGGITWDANTVTSTVTVSAIFSGIPTIEKWDGTTLNKFGLQQVGNILNVFTGNAPVKAWTICAYNPGQVWFAAYTTSPFTFGSSPVINQHINLTLVDNTPYQVGLSLTQSGSTTNWEVFARQIGQDQVFYQDGSRGSNSGGANVTEVQVSSVGDSQGLNVGHIVVRNSNDVFADLTWSNGHIGETTQARMERLCAGHGIHLDVVSAADVPNSSIIDDMGPQFYDTLTSLLRECERTGQGLLYDGLGPGLSYVTKRRRETNANSAATLVLDASTGHLMEPFAPIDDDQLLINRVDVTRRGGTDATYSNLSGPEGVEAVGEYATSIDVNPETDDDLVRYAEWLVGVGTQPGYRYPSVSFALETNPALIPGWLACVPTSRIDVENITAIRRQHPDETIKLLIEGWQEMIDAFTWRVTANTSGAAPWNVAVLAAATGSTGDGICHLQTEGSQLNANYTSGTTISVKTNTGLRWITTGEDADSFPFDISVGGVRATVTGITSTSSPQTFTLSAPLPRTFPGSTTAGLGTPVEVWRPPVYGL